jgi:4-oxalocrotonate tautomerase
MPIAIVHIVEGRSAEKKAALIENVSRAISLSLDAPLETVRVLIQEVPKTQWGIGGTTLADLSRSAS